MKYLQQIDLGKFSEVLLLLEKSSNENIEEISSAYELIIKINEIKNNKYYKEALNSYCQYLVKNKNTEKIISIKISN